MCGIAGFVGHGGRRDLERMTGLLVHRGPDAHGFWVDDGKKVYFGHRRLSIIDLEGGSQPMCTRDGTLIVIFNGEIYNHLELRKQLIQFGHRFLTDHSDTEVLLHGYRQWGKSLPEKLNGMWAFAIFDKTRDELFLARDRFGKKPLYFTLQNGFFAFASELKSLISHSKVQNEISPRALKKFFAYGFIPGPNSIYAGIHKLPGGCNLLLDINTLHYSIIRYWEFRIEPFETLPKNPEEEWGEQLRALMQQAVKRRLMSDVPLGVFLSGGIDSSSVTAFAVKSQGADKVRTFSIAFEAESFDESKQASRVSGQLGTAHHERYFSLGEARALIPTVLGRLDEPLGDSSLLPTYLLCKEARDYITVALGGDGGDELFAGYDPFHALRLAELYDKVVPRPLHRGIRALVGRMPVSHRNMSLDFRLKRALRGLSYLNKLWNPVWLGPLEPAELEELLNEPVDIEDIYSEAIEMWDSCQESNLIDKTLAFYTKLYLQDDILVKVDRASMMNSLEVRAPYLDIDLVEFVRRIPHQYKYRNGQTKYILKKCLEPVLDRAILYRKKKGFGIPIGEWLKRGSLSFEKRPIFKDSEKAFYKKKVLEHKNNRGDNRLYLWCELTLNLLL